MRKVIAEAMHVYDHANWDSADHSAYKTMRNIAHKFNTGVISLGEALGQMYTHYPNTKMKVVDRVWFGDNARRDTIQAYNTLAGATLYFDNSICVFDDKCVLIAEKY